MGFDVREGFKDQKDDEERCRCRGDQGAEEPGCDDRKMHREDSLVWIKEELLVRDDDYLSFQDVVLDVGVEVAEEEQGPDEGDACEVWWCEMETNGPGGCEKEQKPEVHEMEASVMGGEEEQIME